MRTPPAGFADSNTYVGLFVDIDDWTCVGASASRKPTAAARSKLLSQLLGR
ncbi:MAG TPA: hypothetical protein VKR59_20590 [Terriglobales bacterium]|nr:hypothetical protein [Terriglobales bacterium]